MIDERARNALANAQASVDPSASVGGSCRGFISCALRSMRFRIVRMSLTFDVAGFFTERSSLCRCATRPIGALSRNSSPCSADACPKYHSLCS